MSEPDSQMALSLFPTEVEGRQLPTKICLPPTEWPLIDRLKWDRAKTPSGRLDMNAPLARLAPATVKSLENGHGTFLMYLRSIDELDETVLPQDRPRPENISSYIDTLRLRVRAGTIDSYLKNLVLALRVFAPAYNWNWIFKVENSPRRAEVEKSRSKLSPPDPAVVLYEALCEFDENMVRPMSTWRATRARNALIISFCVLFALRRKNLGQLERGTHLLEDGSSFRVAINESMKNHTAVLFDVPDYLIPRLDKYLSEARPKLLGNRIDDGTLWLTQEGTKLTLSTIDKVFRKFGKRRLNRNLHSHLMRHAMASVLVLRNPGDNDLAAAALGHTTTQMVDQVYTKSAGLALSNMWLKKLKRHKHRLGLEH